MQSEGIPDGIARFTEFAAPKLVTPLTEREVVVAYLRIVELDPLPDIAKVLTLKEGAVSVYLWRAKLKLGAPSFHGWERLIAEFHYAAGYAAGRASVAS